MQAPLLPSLALLRSVLEHFEDPAILLSLDYEILGANRAYIQAYGAGLQGRRCYRVSHGYSSPCDQHGESCPLASTLESGQPSRVLHVHHSPAGEQHVDVELRPILDEGGRTVCFIELARPIRGASITGREAPLVGRSASFNRALGLVQRVAPRDLPVLLLGESGTGKELFARVIHDSSPRAGRPFVAVECSGLSPALFESELFGHERGAFTGARSRKPGLVEAAAGGTLFLDEIGDVPLSQQVKLLRLLESGRYRSVGGVQPLQADFRLICATHRDLEARVASGQFRQDLYYRINAFPITLPPLRERPEDIALLAGAFIERGGTGKRFSPAALRLLERWSFPGNIRELRNVVRRAELLCDGDVIEVQHLPEALRGDVVEPPPPHAFADLDAEQILQLDELERRYLAWLVQRFKGDRRSLAHKLGLSERTLYRKLRSALGQRGDSPGGRSDR